MSDFKKFREAVRKQFDLMKNDTLFVVDVGRDQLWETYIKSFPEGTNPIYKERTEHDCNCCKQFVRGIGNVVSIKNNKLLTIWDSVELNDGCYDVVAKAMSDLVRSSTIRDVFLYSETSIGTESNVQVAEFGTVTFNHFRLDLPRTVVKHKDTIGTALGNVRSTYDVLLRGLDEISMDSIDTVLDLIGQNSLYRGEEHKGVVTLLKKHKKEFVKLRTDQARSIYCWDTSLKIGDAASRVRNTVIGTLLVDISNGEDLDKAVKAFESKVAPTNYKRPTALITKSMIDKAQKKVEELGISESLERRFAEVEDLTINNVLFADRSAKKAMNVFDDLKSSVPSNPKKLDKVEEVGIQTFIETILPTAQSLELLFENSHVNNLVSLIAPEHALAPCILKWKNNFSWSYNGEVADSIKERVKAAGGNVEGVLRCSLSWFNHDDLDVHCVEPSGNQIGFQSKGPHRSSGRLDVDMNFNSLTRTPVENITWTDKYKMEEGVYQIFVNNFNQREKSNVGFDFEIEYDGTVHSFHYAKEVRNKTNVIVAKFKFSKKNGIEFIESLESSQSSKEAWGISTNQYHKVKMVMNSPNHWDGEQTGNKHYFFMIEGCKTGQDARGFYNEFLSNELNEHRKVFEVLGSKMKAKVTDNQLSGLGFSSTSKNHVFCKVAGSFNRVVKIVF